MQSGGTIAIFGSSRCQADSQCYAEAHELGRLLASAGHTVMSGGYAGSMGAVSRGAAEAGGRVVGVTCALFDPAPCNPWVTEEIKAATLIERMAVMIERADGFIALRGGIGTLSEVTLVWSLLQVRSVQDRPLILLGAQWRPVVATLLEHTDLGSSIAALAQIAETPAEAVKLLD
jgi:uncharacterized protein (TIGR00730 family)